MKSIYLKSVLLSLLTLSITVGNALAQTEEVKQDTIKKEKNITINIGIEDNVKKPKYPRAFGGITFTRLDWGFSRLLDDGSFNLSEDNAVFRYKKASNFGFDIAQVGVRFNDNFKSYLSAGFEWNYLRLKENVLFTEGTSPLQYEIIPTSDIEYKKNVFTTTYLRLPLTFEWRSAKNHKNDRVKIAFGAMTGILLKGTQRLKSSEDGKQKFKDNYSLASFQYGPFVRIGYDNIGIFGKYYLNDMFEKSPNHEGLNNLTFGLTLGF